MGGRARGDGDRSVRVVDTGRVRISVLSDTHSPRFWKGCPPAVAAALRAPT